MLRWPEHGQRGQAVPASSSPTDRRRATAPVRARRAERAAARHEHRRHHRPATRTGAIAHGGPGGRDAAARRGRRRRRSWPRPPAAPRPQLSGSRQSASPARRRRTVASPGPAADRCRRCNHAAVGQHQRGRPRRDRRSACAPGRPGPPPARASRVGEFLGHQPRQVAEQARRQGLVALRRQPQEEAALGEQHAARNAMKPIAMRQ